MVGPGGEGDVDLVEDVVLLEEVTEETEGTGAGKGLAGGDSVLLDDLGVLTVGEGDGELVELWETIDGRILVIQLAGDALLGLEDAGENDGLAVVVSVGTDAEGDLSGISIGLELLVEAQDGIRGSLSDLHKGRITTGAQRRRKGWRERRLNSFPVPNSTNNIHQPIEWKRIQQTLRGVSGERSGGKYFVVSKGFRREIKKEYIRLSERSERIFSKSIKFKTVR